MKDAMRRHFRPRDTRSILTGHRPAARWCSSCRSGCERRRCWRSRTAVRLSSRRSQHNWSGALGKVEGLERVTKQKALRTDPFNELYISDLSTRARYAPEALGPGGPAGAHATALADGRDPDWWDKTKARPQFKAEYIITHNIRASLRPRHAPPPRA